MPKFLDVPQWYGSDGLLTSTADLSVGIIQVWYKNSSETIEVKAYIPIYWPQSEMAQFETPLHYYSLLAILAHQDLYSLCTGQLRINTTKRADISYMIFAPSGNVIFRANDPTLGIGNTLSELSASFSVTGATKDYTATYLQGPGGAAFLK